MIDNLLKGCGASLEYLQLHRVSPLQLVGLQYCTALKSLLLGQFTPTATRTYPSPFYVSSLSCYLSSIVLQSINQCRSLETLEMTSFNKATSDDLAIALKVRLLDILVFSLAILSLIHSTGPSSQEFIA